MIPRQWFKKQAHTSIQQLLKYTFTRRWLHVLSQKTRGHSIVFLRCRRVLPDNILGKKHRDATNPGALFPKQLASLLEEIQQRLQFLYLGEAISKLRSGKALDQSYVVLTFDEGFESSINAALPILEDMNIPATFFVCSKHLATEDSFMWDQEVHAITQSLSPTPIVVPWMDRQLPTHPSSHATQSANDLLRHLIQLPTEKREQRLRDLKGLCASEIRHPTLDRHINHQELASFAKHSLLSFGSHGHTHHPMLSMTTNTLLAELKQSRTILADVCGQSYVDVLNFPFGSHKQLSPTLIQNVMESGFVAALYDGDGIARPGDHLFKIPRLLLSQKTRILETYEIQGLATALDEALLVLTGSETSKGDIAP